MDRRAVTVSDMDLFDTISWIMTAFEFNFFLLNVAIDFTRLAYFTADKLSISKSVSRGNMPMAPLNVDDSYTIMKDYVSLYVYTKYSLFNCKLYVVAYELSSFTYSII